MLLILAMVWITSLRSHLCGYQSAEGIYSHVYGIREIVWKI